MGFEGWAEMWQAKARQRNLLRQSGARLIKPRVVRAYSCWLQDWHAEAAARAAELAAVVSSQRIESEAARSRMAEAELVEVHSELRQAREALAEAGNDDELRRQVEEPLTIAFSPVTGSHPLSPSHTLSRPLTPSHTLSHPLTPSHPLTFSPSLTLSPSLSDTFTFT